MDALKLYLGSVEIKRLIVKRSNDLRIPLKHICHEVGIEYWTFIKNYINREDSSGFNITVEKFEKILECLGVEARCVVVIKTDFDHFNMKQKLEESYNGERAIVGLAKNDFTVE